MSAITKTKIIKIGNSQGVRIPKLLLDQSNLGDEIELEVQEGRIIIRSAHNPRASWEQQFQLMAEHSDDQMLDLPVPNTWDEEEWEW